MEVPVTGDKREKRTNSNRGTMGTDLGGQTGRKVFTRENRERLQRTPCADPSWRSGRSESHGRAITLH